MPTTTKGEAGMKVSGSATLDAPMDKVWQSFLNPDVLVATIPGCERLEETGKDQYRATVMIGVGSIKGSYQGEVQLYDLKEPDSLSLHAQAAAATGTISVDVVVTFSEVGEGQTHLEYNAEAVVGGMIAGVGQRMLTSVSKRMADEFFNNVNQVLTGQRSITPREEPASGGPDAVAPPASAPLTAHAPPPGAPTHKGDLIRGFVAGALSVLVGVVVGAVVARRR
ncbi:MAG TPA: carbon monoxide dehydrogenase subunit G [Beutenbergiaceae bacterium]|nr:carbon monoxide dehydrogenase subunit G [Beutenbergiaceae bacterium]